ncbi:hypothetical protein BH09ACT11_BH09ACT11_02610 [soil metagenome]
MPNGIVTPTRRQSRFTGRMAVFTLVLLVLAMSFASSVKAYVDQRASIDAVEADIASREAEIDDLSAQIGRWNDPAYVEQQARERFGYVKAGETAWAVLDGKGNRIEPTATLTDPTEVGQTSSDPWWSGAWDSVEVAGNPPKVKTPLALTDNGPLTVDPEHTDGSQ